MQHPAPLETVRLWLLPWAEEHTEFLARLGAMPEVVRFVGNGEVWPRAKAEAVAETQRRHWREHGFGWRAVAEKATGHLGGLAAPSFAGPGTAGGGGGGGATWGGARPGGPGRGAPPPSAPAV